MANRAAPATTRTLTTMRADRNGADRDHCGFSLVELMVVIVILGLLASIVAGNFGQIAAARKQKASRDRLVKRMEYFRSLAVFRGRPVTVEFDLSKQMYRAIEGRPSH